MQRTERDRLENEHLERALREFNRFRQRLSPIWDRSVRALSFPVKETPPGAIHQPVLAHDASSHGA
jgi:hypothetical protein